jgi:phosphopantothenoylcysteine decarboxylase/phosphopantothenate--cysteine ligase
MCALDEHPSKDIIGTRGQELKDRKIIMCITGSVAAVQSPDVARQLMRHGAEVFPVMSWASQKIIHPYVMEWATGNPVVTELTGKIEHVSLIGGHDRKADLVLVAPATANTISKIACGIDDTPVTSTVSTAVGLNIPIIIVPAMHESMYNHPILNENIRKLKSLGIEFVKPRIEEGKAKIAVGEDIVNAVINKFSKKDMVGLKVLVTAGPTLEYIDPVRLITNKSSGKMGVAIANEALRRGAEVTLVYGPGDASPPSNAKVINVETTAEMYSAIMSELKKMKYNFLFATAACADFAPEKAYDYKIPTRKMSELFLKLKPTPKIISDVRKVQPEIFLISFRAEYNLSDDDLIKSAYSHLKITNADLIVANDVSREGVGFKVDTNEVIIIDKNKKILKVPLSTKNEVATKIVDKAIENYQEQIKLEK